MKPMPPISSETMMQESGIITLFHDIEDSYIIEDLLVYSTIRKEQDIYMYIRSDGGRVYEGLAIYDTMQLIPNDVVTIGMGCCASMASILLAAGTKGKRFVTPNTWIMIHQPWGGAIGKSDEMEIAAAHMKQLKEQCYNILGKHTGQGIKKIEEAMRLDCWFNPKQAIEFGLIDGVKGGNENGSVSNNTPRVRKANGNSRRIRNKGSRF